MTSSAACLPIRLPGLKSFLRRGVRTALKIYQAEKRPAAHELPVGTIRTDRKSYIDIAVEDGYLRLLSVQLAGKKRLPVTDFLNGFKQIGEYKVD